MSRWIIVSNINDHGSGDHGRGCGCGLLYQIQMIMMVTSIDEELDCCIEYKRSCEGEDQEEIMVVVRRKEWSVV